MYGEAAEHAGVTYSGFVNEENEDTEGALTGTLTYSYKDSEGQDYTTDSNAGEYKIIPSGLSTANLCICRKRICQDGKRDG